MKLLILSIFALIVAGFGTAYALEIDAEVPYTEDGDLYVYLIPNSFSIYSHRPHEANIGMEAIFADTDHFNDNHFYNLAFNVTDSAGKVLTSYEYGTYGLDYSEIDFFYSIDKIESEVFNYNYNMTNIRTGEIGVGSVPFKVIEKSTYYPLSDFRDIEPLNRVMIIEQYREYTAEIERLNDIISDQNTSIKVLNFEIERLKESISQIIDSLTG